jgi:hypothetical protein
VQFQAPDGRLVTASSDVASMDVPSQGDRVTVLFDPDRPKQVHIDSGASDEPDMVDKSAWCSRGSSSEEGRSRLS